MRYILSRDLAFPFQLFLPFTPLNLLLLLKNLLVFHVNVPLLLSKGSVYDLVRFLVHFSYFCVRPKIVSVLHGSRITDT